MLRTTLIAFAAASALGVSLASAAPLNGSVVAAAADENGSIQQVWYRHYYHPRWWRHRHHWRRWW